MITSDYIELENIIDCIIDNRGKTVPTVPEGIPLIATNCIKIDSLYPSFENLRYISQHTYDTWFRSHLKPNDILFVNKGTPGRACIVPDPVNFVAAQDMVGLRFKSNLNPYFMLALLRSAPIQKMIQNNFVGLVIPHYRKQELLKLKLPIFDQITRDYIGDIYEVLSKKIEVNNNINRELEKTVRLIYDYWFTQYEFTDVNGKSYKSNGGAMVYSTELNDDIPINWEVKKLKDLYVFEKGTEPGASAYIGINTNEKSIKFYRVGDIGSDSKTYVDEGIFKLKKVVPGDVVVSFDGTVGKMGISLDGAISGGLRHIYDKSGLISSACVWAIFGDPRIRASIHKYSTGSVLLHASSSIEHLTMAYNVDVLMVFQKTIQPIYDQIVLNNNESAELVHLRDWLLPMLMTGQVRVSNYKGQK